MVRLTSFALVLGAAIAEPTSDLTERQLSRPVNIDLYLPEITFLSLGSSATLQQIFLGAGYSGVNDNKLSAGVSTLAKIFSQNTTPLNTFVGNIIAPIYQQQSNNNTNYNYTKNALAAKENAAAAASTSTGNSASAGVAIAGQSGAGVSSSSSPFDDPNPAFAFSQVADNANGGRNINVTVGVAGGSITRTYSSIGNETVEVGACAAKSSGATAYSSFNTTTTISVNGTSYGTPVVHSRAQTTCEAGTADRKNARADAQASVDDNIGFPSSSSKRWDIGSFFGSKVIYSLSGVQAACKERGGAQATVNCNGASRTGIQLVKYRLQITGTYSVGAGFVGNITGRREASATATCT